MLVIFAFPTTSMATQGLFVDPDSPTAKEYALPLDDARRKGAGERGSSAGGGLRSPAKLFGEGIANGSTRKVETLSQDSNSARSNAQRRATPSTGTSLSQIAPDRPSERSATIGTLAIVLAVLSGGGLIAVVLRRLGQRSAD